jgi:TRAP-type C4-dicarboxylate transport system permease small subunit
MRGNWHQSLATVEMVGKIIVTLLMLAMIAVTVADVVGRRFGITLAASFEVTQLLVALTFYLALPQATARRAHIVVDVIPQRHDRVLDLVVAALVDLLSAFVMAWAAAMLIRQGQTLDRFNTLLQFTRLPLSPFVLVMGVFAWATALVCLAQAALRLHAATTLGRAR